MGNSEAKDVNFYDYCKTCKHRDKDDYESPCNECLIKPVRDGTFVPIYWEGKKK